MISYIFIYIIYRVFYLGGYFGGLVGQLGGSTIDPRGMSAIKVLKMVFLRTLPILRGLCIIVPAFILD